METTNRTRSILAGAAMVTVLTVGTIGVGFTAQNDWSCCSSMKEDACPVVKEQKLSHEKLKAIQGNFEQNKYTQGWSGNGR